MMSQWSRSCERCDAHMPARDWDALENDGDIAAYYCAACCLARPVTTDAAWDNRSVSPSDKSILVALLTGLRQREELDLDGACALAADVHPDSIKDAMRILARIGFADEREVRGWKPIRVWRIRRVPTVDPLFRHFSTDLDRSAVSQERA